MTASITFLVFSLVVLVSSSETLAASRGGGLVESLEFAESPFQNSWRKSLK